MAPQGVGRHGPVLLKSYYSPWETCKCGFRHFCVGTLEERESETNSEHSRKSSGNSSTLVETQTTVWEINTPKTKIIHTQWFEKTKISCKLVCSFSQRSCMMVCAFLTAIQSAVRCYIKEIKKMAGEGPKALEAPTNQKKVIHLQHLHGDHQNGRNQPVNLPACVQLVRTFKPTRVWAILGVPSRSATCRRCCNSSCVKEGRICIDIIGRLHGQSGSPSSHYTTSGSRK